MRNNAHEESASEKEKDVKADDGIELTESDLESVAGGVTWHPNVVEDTNKWWEDTPDL